MLTRIKIENFKCFKELDLKCAPLTLLTGINGTGKSSVFQALMLIRRTFVETLTGPPRRRHDLRMADRRYW